MNMDTPRKIYVEITTRCNLHCSKCLKTLPASVIPERDMAFEAFKKLLPDLSSADALILNGIGEPLLHNDLLKMLKSAHGRMKDGSLIGFQTNGSLLTPQYSRDLLENGLNTICFSVDSIKSGTTHCSSNEHSFAVVEKAVGMMDYARKEKEKRCEIGLEVVLKRESIEDLPRLVQWAAENRIDFILTTHLIPYEESFTQQTLFNTNSSKAYNLYERYRHKAVESGIDLAGSYKKYRRFAGTQSEEEELAFFRELQDEANRKDIRLNIRNLVAMEELDRARLKEIFAESEKVARSGNIDIFLPPLQAEDERYCRFMEEKAAFINVQGEVVPCHFLWHTYPCWLLEDEIQVEECGVGNIMENGLNDIWNDLSYRSFRVEALNYDYTDCWSCPLAPCTSLVNDNISKR